MRATRWFAILSIILAPVVLGLVGVMLPSLGVVLLGLISSSASIPSNQLLVLLFLLLAIFSLPVFIGAPFTATIL